MTRPLRQLAYEAAIALPHDDPEATAKAIMRVARMYGAECVIQFCKVTREGLDNRLNEALRRAEKGDGHG